MNNTFTICPNWVSFLPQVMFTFYLLFFEHFNLTYKQWFFYLSNIKNTSWDVFILNEEEINRKNCEKRLYMDHQLHS